MHTLVRIIGIHVVAALLWSSVSAASFAQSPYGEFGEGLPLPASVSCGVLFHNGEYIPAPYVIDSVGGAVVVNGVELNLAQEQDEEFDRPEKDNRRGGARNGRGGPGGGPPGWQRGSRGTGGGGRKRELVPAAPKKKSVSSDKQARQIAASLRRAEHVVVFDESPLRLLSNPADRFFLADAFLSSSPTNEQRREFVALGPVGSRDRWERWLNEFSPNAALQQELETERNSFLQTEKRERSTVAARQRLDSAAYPMTIAAMVLGVIAFGHMLQWVAQGFVIKGEESIALGASFSAKALLLMLAMSGIDLVWTILALQAGAMSEVNPLAGQFASSPLQLTLFKIVATGGALSILYAWRLQPKVQKATWWMCLVCILLTFRWVVFDSMMQ